MNRTHLLRVTAAVLTFGLAMPANAAGVGAGTLISNTASASFDNGSGATTTVQSNTVTVRVDELLDVAATSLASGTTSLTGATTALPFRVSNTGNGVEAFNLAVTTAVAGNQFDATLQGLALDTNGNGVYDTGVDTLLGGSPSTGALAADATATVFVLVSLPSGTADGATGQVRLTAAAATGSGAAGTVFAGAGTGGGDAVVGASTASANALAALVASSVSVTLTKTAAIADPFGGSRPVPGAIVTYSLVAAASGSGSAANVRLTDVIPTGTTYRPGTLTLEGASLSDAADADAGAASAAGIDVVAGSIAAGSTRTVTFRVRIN